MSENFTKIIERLKFYIDLKGYTFNQLATSIGVSNSYFSKMVKSNGSLGEDIIKNILLFYDDINPEWFILGKGEMLKTDGSTPALPHKKNIEYLHSQTFQNVVSEPNPQYISQNIISIPIVDVAAAAGFGYSNPDYTETLGELSFPANLLKRRTGNYYCGRVDGDSMVPTLLYGDFIIFRLLSPAEWEDVKDGDIYFVVNRSGHAFVKRIKNRLKQEGFIICQSDNPDKINKDFQISNDDISNIYHVEWRFSNDMTNINQLYFSRLDTLEEQMKNIHEIVKKSVK